MRWILACALLAAACGDDGESVDPSDGRLVYEQPFEDGNSFACATCHALSEPAADGFRRPGHPIGNATRRPNFKNGLFTDIRDAVNTCVDEWMDAEPLEAEDERWQALFTFLDAQATVETEEPIVIDIVSPPADLSGGDMIAGMNTFNSSCAVCHGMGASGTMQAPSLIGEELDRETIARRIRTSGFRGSTTYEGLTGGRMPFWASDRISETELLDLVAYVEEIGRAEIPDDAGMPMDGGMTMDAGPSGCESTHPRVGQTATLSTFSHDVAGTARIVDDCTIVIDNFTFDGGGINIQIYGGQGGDYSEGPSLTGNLLGMRFDNETFTITLPDGVTFDDFDGISVWCVPVGVSFGDGQFM